MAVVNFCVRAFLPGCCFLMNIHFSFKVSKASYLPMLFQILLAARNPETLCIAI